MQKQQLIGAQHDVSVEQITSQTPAHKIQSQLIAAVLSQHLNTKMQQVRKLDIPDKCQCCKQI